MPSNCVLMLVGFMPMLFLISSAAFCISYAMLLDSGPLVLNILTSSSIFARYDSAPASPPYDSLNDPASPCSFAMNSPKCPIKSSADSCASSSKLGYPLLCIFVNMLYKFCAIISTPGVLTSAMLSASFVLSLKNFFLYSGVCLSGYFLPVLGSSASGCPFLIAYAMPVGPLPFS